MPAKELKKYVQQERSKIIESNCKAIKELIEASGGIKALAEYLNVPETTVSSWSIRGRISKAGAYMVAEHGILGKYYKAEDLRLDLANK